MQVLIYGAGAVGCYIGGHLALAGHGVTLLGRTPLIQAVEARGITLHLRDGIHSIRTLRAVDTLAAALNQPTPFDWIAFTVKAYDTASAAWELQAYLPEPPPLVSFQNGIGNEDTLRSIFGSERVVAASLTSPVSMPTLGTVVEEKRRGVAVADDSPAADLVTAALRQTTLSLQVVRNSNALKWSKLLLNMVANAVPAIVDMTPGEVFSDPTLFGVEWAALREALWIMDLKGIDLVDLPGAPARTFGALVRHVPPFALRLLLRRQVSSGRGDKLPSLLAALRSGQRKTEVAWLNGAVVQSADSLKRLAPVNHALALTVSDIAAGRIPWDAYRHNPELLLAAVNIARGYPDRQRN